jgi:hypothetical protein
VKSLQAKTIHGQLDGTSERGRAAYGKGSERGRRGPANLGKAGTGQRRRARPARAGRAEEGDASGGRRRRARLALAGGSGEGRQGEDAVGTANLGRDEGAARRESRLEPPRGAARRGSEEWS